MTSKIAATPWLGTTISPGIPCGYTYRVDTPAATHNSAVIALGLSRLHMILTVNAAAGRRDERGKRNG